MILGIRFYTGSLARLLERTAQGGLIAVPSAPVLTRLPEDAAHREAVEGCDFAITDSGFLVLLWWLLQGERLERISGLRFLIALLQQPGLRAPGRVFWVMPSPEDAAANQRWLQREGWSVGPDAFYLAPRYAPQGALADPVLLATLEKQRPDFVVLCLGGGVQERLGWYLRQSLQLSGLCLGLATDDAPEPGTNTCAHRSGQQCSSQVSSSPYTPAIICTGAAIAFLSGRQTSIPPWADRFFLGWLFRLVTDPARFLPRYWHALRLLPLLLKYRERSVAS